MDEDNLIEINKKRVHTIYLTSFFLGVLVFIFLAYQSKNMNLNNHYKICLILLIVELLSVIIGILYLPQIIIIKDDIIEIKTCIRNRSYHYHKNNINKIIKKEKNGTEVLIHIIFKTKKIMGIKVLFFTEKECNVSLSKIYNHLIPK